MKRKWKNPRKSPKEATHLNTAAIAKSVELKGMLAFLGMEARKMTHPSTQSLALSFPRRGPRKPPSSLKMSIRDPPSTRSKKRREIEVSLKG